MLEMEKTVVIDAMTGETSNCCEGTSPEVETKSLPLINWPVGVRVNDKASLGSVVTVPSAATYSG